MSLSMVRLVVFLLGLPSPLLLRSHNPDPNSAPSDIALLDATATASAHSSSGNRARRPSPSRNFFNRRLTSLKRFDFAPSFLPMPAGYYVLSFRVTHSCRKLTSLSNSTTRQRRSGYFACCQKADRRRSAPADLLGRPLWHARGSVRHTVDSQLRGTRLRLISQYGEEQVPARATVHLPAIQTLGSRNGSRRAIYSR